VLWLCMTEYDNLIVIGLVVMFAAAIAVFLSLP
jgi:hypothetical protein